jgi:hypothetical protein
LGDHVQISLCCFNELIGQHDFRPLIWAMFELALTRKSTLVRASSVKN